MYEHSFFNIILTLFFYYHHVWLKSYASLGSSVWFLTHLVILWLMIFFDAYVVNPKIWQIYIYFVVFMGEGMLPHMMQFGTLLPPLLRMPSSMFRINKLMFFWYHLSSRVCGDDWILCLQQMVFAFWQKVIIVNLTCANLVLWITSFQGMTTMIVV
jgi:hypothetical protein